MKIILILAIVVVTVIAIGVFLPKRHVVSRSAAYHATANQLFSLIVGDQNWRPDVTHCELLSGEGDVELMKERTRHGETITYELLDRTPPTSLKRRIADRNLPYSGTWTFSLQPDAADTIVRITEDGEVYNPIFRFMSRFVLGHTSTMDTYLRALGKATGAEVEIHD